MEKLKVQQKWAEEIQLAEDVFEMLLLNIPVQSIIYTGSDQAEKIDLLKLLFKSAMRKRFFCKEMCLTVLYVARKATLHAPYAGVQSF